jgi:glucose/arabinose dehydrogenase
MGRFMSRCSLALSLAVALSLGAAAAHSEDAAPLTPAPSDASRAPTKPAKKAAHKNVARKSESQQSAEAADKAARLEEGRNKFFQRSMGFDNGGGSGSPVTLQGENGLSPSMGFKF